MPQSTDPLLQPFQLKHLTLRNRIMTTAHEPAYARMACRKSGIAPITWSARKAALR